MFILPCSAHIFKKPALNDMLIVGAHSETLRWQMTAGFDGSLESFGK